MSESNESTVLRLALPKGRILGEVLPLVRAAGIEPERAFDDPDAYWEWVARQQRCPWRLATRVVVETCTGLHFAHEFRSLDGEPQEIVHRDVSPANILCSFEGAVKIVDFGKTREDVLYMIMEHLHGEPLFVHLPEYLQQYPW